MAQHPEFGCAAAAAPATAGDTKATPLGRQILGRLTALWVLKAIGISAFMALFFSLYLHLLKSPLFPVTTMPLTLPDRLIGFHPEALLLYGSLWVYVSLPPALMPTRHELIRYGLAAMLLCLAGLACFLFWPTAVPPADVDWARYPGFAFLKNLDTAGNACPSLHVATAAFSAVWLHRQLREMGGGRTIRVGSALWCAGIVYSTLATKQHVALDVLAGLALGFAAAGIACSWIPGESPTRVAGDD